MFGAILNHIADRIHDTVQTATKPLMALLVFAGTMGQVHAAANFSSLATLVTSLGVVIDAVIGIVPSVITLIAYFAVGAFIGGLFTIILDKMKFS
jgi:hypothetical protein